MPPGTDVGCRRQARPDHIRLSTGTFTDMSAPAKRTPAGRPAVLARLAAEAEQQHVEHAPPAWSRWAGRILVVAILVVIAVTVVTVHPW